MGRVMKVTTLWDSIQEENCEITDLRRYKNTKEIRFVLFCQYI